MPVPTKLKFSRPMEIRLPTLKRLLIRQNQRCWFMHAKGFELMVHTNTLPCNVKFMIEGEEEIGSPNLGKWCEQNKEMLKADIILVSDTSMIARDVPSITTGLRGLAYWQVEVTGPNRDLHSGMFGGAVANPINALTKMIAQMTDDKGRITIPGFYDDVIEIAAEERAMLAKAPFSLEDFKKAIEVEEVSGEEGYSTKERTGIRPSFDVCGIWGGYMGEGAKTVMPSKAFAKISTRLVPAQDHTIIAILFKEYFESIAPKGIKVEVTRRMADMFMANVLFRFAVAEVSRLFQPSKKYWVLKQS